MARRIVVEYVAELAGFRRGMRAGADDVRKLKDESKAAQAEVGKLGHEARAAREEVGKLGEAGAKAGAQLAEGIIRGADGKLRDAKGKFVKAGAGLFDGDAGVRVGEQLADGVVRGADGRLRDARGRFVKGDGLFGGREGDESALKTGRRWGAKVAEGLASGLANAGTFGGRVFGGLPPQAQLAIGASIVGAGVAAAPLLGGVIAGAVVGGVGLGGVVGGLALAAGDYRVQAAANETGDLLGKTMRRSASAFVPATVDALGLIRTEIKSMEPDLKHVFDGASKFVRPLTEGMLGFFRELMPGIKDAIDQGGPVIDELASWGPKLGRLGSDLLSKFADHAEEGAEALHMLFAIADVGARSLGSTIEGLAVLFGWLDKFNQLTGGSIVENFERAFGGDTERRLISLRKPTEEWAIGLQATADLTRTNSTAMELWNETMARMGREGRGAFDAATNLGAAIANANKLAKDGKDTLDANTKAGRDNRNALSDLAAAAVTAAEKQRDLTGSQADGQAKMDEGYVAFIKAAGGMGVGEQAAHDLAVQLGLIPSPKVSVSVSTTQATTAIANVVTYLDKVNGKTVTTYIKVKTIGDTDHITSSTGGGRSIQRWGGVYEHAAEGRLREAQIASPMGPARYAWAEPATGGEAFIPRRGDRERSVSIGRRAMEWYGMDVVPRSQGARWVGGVTAAGGSGGAAPTVGDTYVYVTIDGQQLEGRIDRVVRESNRGLKRRATTGSGARR